MKLTREEIRRRFRGRGVKITPQRAAIYKALVERADHPTAEDLHRKVRRVYPMVSPNTVYYTLGVLKEAGLVHEVNYWRDRSRFDGKIDLHHHLICLRCRTICDVTDAALDGLNVSACVRAGFEITGHRVEFHGYCAACRRTRQHQARASRGKNSSYLKRRVR